MDYDVPDMNEDGLPDMDDTGVEAAPIDSITSGFSSTEELLPDPGIYSSVIETLPGTPFINEGVPGPHDVAAPFSETNNDNSSIIGADDALEWEEQTTPFTCGIMSVRSILESLTHNQYTESQLMYDAQANGWLTEDGMGLSDIANLFEHEGVPCEVVRNGSINGLVHELEAGNRAVVAVDSGELWENESMFEDFSPFDGGADHAIVVSGIRSDANGDPVVIINDSGVMDGAGKEVSLDVFVDAWNDSRFSYVVTRDNLVVEGGLDAGGIESDLMAEEQRNQFLKDI
ncbi:MAG: hypothetical protein JXR78_08555 [Victivallales bacterium]|nr:hypothetical protein [Victivallales bacterium]